MIVMLSRKQLTQTLRQHLRDVIGSGFDHRGNWFELLVHLSEKVLAKTLTRVGFLLTELGTCGLPNPNVLDRKMSLHRIIIRVMGNSIFADEKKLLKTRG